MDTLNSTNAMKRAPLAFALLAVSLAGCAEKAPPAEHAAAAAPAPAAAPAVEPAAPAVPAAPEVLADGTKPVSRRVENMHLTRFVEIFLAAKDPASGRLVAACYNTLFNAAGIPESKDTAPQSLVAGLDFEGMKQTYGVLHASLNGPKLWTPDWSEIEAGITRNFNGLEATWVAQLEMGDNAGGVSETTPYKPMTIARKSSLGWNRGTTVLLLDDADGTTWIMKGFQLGMEPRHTYADFLAGAASMFSQLPPGWKVRTKTLEQDLIETPENGVATIMSDEHFNVYDKTGPGMSNYVP